MEGDNVDFSWFAAAQCLATRPCDEEWEEAYTSRDASALSSASSNRPDLF
jgi:hypothetical protein